MATWDGSYPEPDGSNYYVNSYGNHTSANVPSCDYFLGNSNDAFSQNATPFTINTSMVFNQSTPNYYDPVLRNGISSVMPNVAPTNVYTSNEIQSVNQSIERSSGVQSSTLNNQPCFYENNKVQNQQTPSHQLRSNNYYSGTKRRDTNRMYQADNNIAEHSNLHATATEFVPNKNKQDYEPHINSSRNSKSKSKNNFQNKDTDQTSNKIFFEDNKVRYNDRKFENKRDAGRRWRENAQNNQFNNDDKKDYARNQNFKRFQSNDKYNQNKSFSEKPRNNRFKKKDTEKIVSESNTNSFENEEEKSYNDCQDSSNSNLVSSFETDSVKSAASLTTKNSKTFLSNKRNDRYDRKEKYNPKDPRDRKSHYSDYSSYSRNNYSRGDNKSNFNRDDNGHNRSNYNRDDNGHNRSNYNRDDTRHNRSNYSRDDSEHNRNNYSRNEGGHNRNDYNKDDSGPNKSNPNKFEKRENRNFVENRCKDIIDWRQKSSTTENKNSLLKRPYHKKYEPDDDACQKERLTELLNRGQLECLVCCESIRQMDYTWSCKNCFHVLHLKCVKKWATSSQDDAGWRCPACQNVTSEVPLDYLCFCGKIKTPEWNRRDTAHSCGEICGRSRSELGCVHKCTLLCHPGSCSPCLAMVTKFCGCGRTSKTHKCSAGPMLLCEDVCDKILNCGVHKCNAKCHHGSCNPCDKIIKQECYCGKHSREATCILDLPTKYSCGNVCDKNLDCGNHKCTDICHGPDNCKPCLLKPECITHCCCGQSPLTSTRKSCLDPIPTCDKICNKRLKCGQPSNPHICKKNCHEGDCPECELTTKVKCRCGYMDKEIACRELTSKADDARCEKKCTKKRSCGKHKCNQMCCIDIEHICPLPCSKNLSCGRHKCEQTCHKGRCQPCWRSSFDELYCECGAAVIYPPVACGTRPPPCDKPCSRPRPCGHEVLHNCHSDATCPPCTVLTQKWCYGKHELRKAVPCYVIEVSCGLPCCKPISCGRHKCIQICHSGPCEKPNQVCVQPCTVIRESCDHICGAPCHEKCPDTPCKETVKVTCQCGHRTMTRMCAENARDYQRIASGFLASKMAEMQLGHSVDLEEVFGQGSRKQNQLKTLECNEECKMIERNRRLTLGLQIVNPDLSGKLLPKYSEFMKQWGKKDPIFCQMIHDKLTELVQLAKTSKQKSRSYSFESMNRDKRTFVHELCEHFGCESQAYDQEPKRNIVATAVKDKCWLPSYSLMELLQRESGQRKVPRPMLNMTKLNSTERNLDSLQLNSKKNLKPQSTTSSTPPKSPEPEIDYFNYKG